MYMSAYFHPSVLHFASKILVIHVHKNLCLLLLHMCVLLKKNGCSKMENGNQTDLKVCMYKT